MPKISTSPPKYFCCILCVLSTSFPPAEATIHHSNCRLPPPPHSRCPLLSLLCRVVVSPPSAAISPPGVGSRSSSHRGVFRPSSLASDTLSLSPEIQSSSQHESPSRNTTCSSDSCGHRASSFSWKGFPVFPRYEGFCSANPAIQPAK
jgi:hypothetical protein